MTKSSRTSVFKRSLPFLLLVLMAVITIAIRYHNRNPESEKEKSAPDVSIAPRDNTKLDRNSAKLYFTKHARCRMKCRHITQQEIRSVLQKGTINYGKSNLKDPKGATFALEGKTTDGQSIRVIFAPKQRHTSVVTVIDLGVEHACDCN
ncbi:DUF4258 domain-containing protein [Segetibacter sp. 3557_3]|uniref:DUF4258 domain-containing protein n=1 Tax=Segetibacter sp. 3557_3 TaxID=2547429 RepID=UPI00140462E2|nr:DUF4258 domain-containing protein [Segetibacter sp. 3557_3]